MLARVHGVAKFLIFSLISSFAFGLPPVQATAHTVAFGHIGLYMDEPFVQGSYASGANTKTETFDSLAIDAENSVKSCEATNSIELGELLSDCSIYSATSSAAPTYSAATNLGDPTVGGTTSGFLTSFPGNKYTVNFAEEEKYVGFWWATASAGNLVKFYSNSSLVAEISIDGVNSLIGEAPVSDEAYALDTSTVTSVDGNTQYFKKYYFGNPRFYSEFSGGTPNTLLHAPESAPAEAFVYIHAFAGEGVSFNRIEFITTLGGFEIDNLTASSDQIAVDSRLVLIDEIPTQGTYSGLATSSGSGNDWINLQGSQLARSDSWASGYQTIYWLGSDVNGNWDGPWEIVSTGGSIRNNESDSSIDVLLPENNFTYIIFWIDWCENILLSSNCIALHYGDTNLENQDLNYRFRKTRTITYQVSGYGSIQGEMQQVVTYGTDGTSVTAVADAGSQFIKWSDDGSVPPLIEATRTDRNIVSDLAVTAEFATINPEEFAVIYESQGATTPHFGGSTTYTAGSAISEIPSTPPIKTGYRFIGWYTSASGGIEVSNGTYTPASPYGAVTLFAHWRRNSSSCNSGKAGTVQFAPDSSKLTTKNKRTLVSLVKRFQNSGCSRMKLIGYTSLTTKNPTANNVRVRGQLSKARATTVKIYLKNRLRVAVPITAEGRSSKSPISSNTSEKTRIPNRRVEVWFY